MHIANNIGLFGDKYYWEEELGLAKKYLWIGWGMIMDNINNKRYHWKWFATRNRSFRQSFTRIRSRIG